jgi:translation initiation factor 1
VPRPGRVVYSTRLGRVCPVCGWPQDDCRCSKNLPAPNAPVPEKVTAKLRLENRSSGKHVTVIDGLPENPSFLETLCRDLKKACGTGGASKESSIELQGDRRERLREILPKKGIKVRG